MGRRNSGLLSDLYEIFSKLPWWLGVLFAGCSYLILNHYSIQPIVDTSKPLEHIPRMMLAQVCFIGQYLVPSVIVLGSFASYLGKLKRARLFNGVKSAVPNSDPLGAVSWRDFEALVAEYFRSKQFKVQECGGPSDGGIDLRLVSLTNDLYLVQCKHWKSSKVPVNVVRELYGVMSATGAAGGYVVTSGEFTSDAQAFARDCNISLLDGVKLVQEVQGRSAVTSISEAKPVCPLCRSEMAIRVANRGIHAGNKFWGCSRFPRCRGVVSIDN